MEKIFKLQYDDNEYYLVNDMDITIATTDKILLKEDGDMGKLSLKNCQAIANGYDLGGLIEEVREEFYQSKLNLLGENTNKVTLVKETAAFSVGFDRGFKKALEFIGDKKFSIDDIQNIIDSNEDSLIYQTVNEDGDISFCLDEDVLIQSLQQTEWDVEIVMECVIGCKNLILNGENSLCCGNKKPKLDEDGCLILKRK